MCELMWQIPGRHGAQTAGRTSTRLNTPEKEKEHSLSLGV